MAALLIFKEAAGELLHPTMPTDIYIGLGVNVVASLINIGKELTYDELQKERDELHSENLDLRRELDELKARVRGHTAAAATQEKAAASGWFARA